MFKKLLTALAVAGVTSSALAQTTYTPPEATEQSGNMQVIVNVPEVLVLYHWDTATITLTDDIVSQAEKTGNGTGTTGINSSDVTVIGSLDTDRLINNGSKIQVTLENAWAVRALTTSGKVELNVDGLDPNLKDESEESIIKMEELKLSTTNATDNDADTIKFDSQWDPKKGDINFTLNLADLKKAGTHKSIDTLRLTLSRVAP